MAAKNRPSVVDTTGKLARLRELFTKEQYNLTAYIIPSEDAHQSEYIAACDGRRGFISGFTGSAGLAIVSKNSAALFTDGRYFLQASLQLDSNWTLMKQGLPCVPTWQEYLVQELPEGSRIGIDPTLISVSEARNLSESLGKVGSSLVATDRNLVDIVWGEERPSRPAHPIIVLPIEYAGRSHTDKIASLREELAKANVYGFVVSALDEIAWLFNLRGSDIECNPVFFAYALVTKEEVALYTDAGRLTNEVKHQLGSEINFHPYEAIFNDIRGLKTTLKAENQKILLSNRASLALAQAADEGNVELNRSPLLEPKAIKNEVELEGIRQCHLRDAVAVINYFAWLEEQLALGKNLTELDGSNRLEKFRAELKDFVGLSFETISASGPNGAIIHYKPEPETCALIDPSLLYLCDSGGQYRDGTTDITRTIHFGIPTEQEKHAFTRYNLDVLARAALWKDGLDFRHGTGHGVGHYLNVHEGPHGIGTRITFNDTPLQAGMTVTDEPGYYEDGKFGIRIESVLLVCGKKTPHNFGERGYLGFEHVSMVPIQTKLIENSLLNPAERQWVNDFNAECLQKVRPLLKPHSLGLKWLEREAVSLK
ncbi:hypothetical protein G9A89_013287 [Geosiphon pyriformis]|nr:hypothetical protein G9A89_013287 [Geosiphon pyriformis]